MQIDDGPWAIINRKAHRLDSSSTPSRTLCRLPYSGWIWDAEAIRRHVEANPDRKLKKKLCQTCEQKAARLARIAAGTALFPPVRPVPPEVAAEQIRRRRAQELTAIDQEARTSERSVSPRTASAGLPTLGRH